MKIAQPLPYAEHAINKLRIAGFKIFVITNRSDTDMFREYTEEWLARHNLYYDELYMTPDKDGIVARKKVDGVVDDRHDILSSIAKNSNVIRPLKYGMYCVKTPWNKRYYNPSILKVKHVAEAVDKIVALKGKV